jgi:DNA-binding NtrC family response regulator
VDEQAVREVTARILEAKGYHVLKAALPSEAEKILSAQGDKIALLLTDVIMPERNGRQLYESICQHYPHLKILFMSGYTDEAISHHGVLDPGTPFIQKPFTSEALIKKIREVLGGEDEDHCVS